MLGRLADLSSRRPRRMVGATIAFLLVAAVVGAPVISKLTTGSLDFQDPAAENLAARHQLEAATNADPNPAVVALIRTKVPVRSPAGLAEVRRTVETISKDPAVARAAYRPGGLDPSFVSGDGHATYVAVEFKPLSEKEQVDAAKRLQDRFKDSPTVTLGGAAVATEQINSTVTEDLRRAELFAAPLLILLSLVFFRGLVAALLPIACAIVSILGSFLALRIVHAITPVSIFSTNLITGLGIGLGIDYSLFIVSRYREELAAARSGPEALRRTLQTAGRTVLFSALTVAAGMAALFAFPHRFLYSMAIGGVVVALLSALAALLFLPALLALLGPRVNALAPKRWQHQTAGGGEEAGFWYRLSRFVMRRAVPVAIVAAAVMIALGIPFFHVKFTGVDASVLPTTASARQVQDALQTEFPSNRSSPIYVAIEAPPSDGAAVREFSDRVSSMPGVLSAGSPRPLGDDTWRLDVISGAPDLATTSQSLVRDIRDAPASFPVLVGGETAAYVDQQDSVSAKLPLAVAIAAVTTLILLFAMTGSVILPLKAVVMSLLTIVGTVGVLVFVFQDGRLEGLLSYTSQGALNSTQPILVAAIAFALSTDYAVFLLTRIKEARARVDSDTEAVAIGMERTGRIVTAAALLLAIALGAFVTSRIVLIKELGFGVAFAVLIDAVIVRAFLVPSLMRLLGKWNWWAPAPLRRLYDRFGLREGDDVPTSPVVGHE